MRRPRGPGGRFLTADEVAAMEKNQAANATGIENIPNQMMQGSGQKRKASAAALSNSQLEAAAKKARSGLLPANAIQVGEGDLEEIYGEDG